jgi:CRISPR/Cas system-associated protein Csx1
MGNKCWQSYKHTRSSNTSCGISVDSRTNIQGDCQHFFPMMYYSTLYVCTTVDAYSPWCITRPCMFVRLSTLIPYNVLLDHVCLYDCQHLFPMMYYSTLYACTTVNTYSPWCITRPCMFVRLSTLIPHDVLLHLVCLYDCQHLFPMMYYSTLYVCTTVTTYSPWLTYKVE